MYTAKILLVRLDLFFFQQTKKLEDLLSFGNGIKVLDLTDSLKKLNNEKKYKFF